MGFSSAPSAALNACSALTPSIRPACAQVAMFCARTPRWKLITASRPASPAMLTPSVKPPFASIGISGMLMWKLLPPMMGTQSGMSRPSPLMPEMALLISAITAFTGVFSSPTSAPNAPPNICFTPSHA